MKPLVLAATLILGSAFAQGWTLEGNARFYALEEARVHARLLGDEEGEIEIGSIDAGGRFRLTLPDTAPVTLADPGSECNLEVTPGLKIAIVERLEVRRDTEFLGELSLGSKPISNSEVGLGSRRDPGKFGFLFYANQNGNIRQRCVTDRESTFANVELQPGWNWITARVAVRDDKPALYLSSGVQTGLMRWWFVAAKP